MKKTHQISILLIAVIAILFSACGNSKYPGFKKTKKGLYYKFYTQNKDAKQPSIGDILVGEFKVRTADSTIATNAGNPGRFTALDSVMFAGDINEGLAMLHIGDSATFIVSADSMKSHHMNLPEFVKPGAVLYFDIKLKEIVTKDSFEKERKEMGAQKQKVMEEAKAKEATDMEKYLSDNKIKVKATESGLYYVELKKGNGAKAETGKKVKVNYIGKLLSGKVFDTNIKEEAKKANVYNEKRPYDAFEFELGKREVIPGWEEGLSMMKVGGKAKFIIPSKLGYGENGAGGVIPPYAPLVFEVELLGVK